LQRFRWFLDPAGKPNFTFGVDHFGWEWLVESWLIREAEYGNVDLPSRRK